MLCKHQSLQLEKVEEHVDYGGSSLRQRGKALATHRPQAQRVEGIRRAVMAQRPPVQGRLHFFAAFYFMGTQSKEVKGFTASRQVTKVVTAPRAPNTRHPAPKAAERPADAGAKARKKAHKAKPTARPQAKQKKSIERTPPARR